MAETKAKVDEKAKLKKVADSLSRARAPGKQPAPVPSAPTKKP